jgi:hypothetical protein
MFTCYNHGWNHLINPCPICHPPGTLTTSSTQIDLHNIAGRIDAVSVFKEGTRVEKIARAVAKGMNKLGWQPDVPASTGILEWEGNCHECITIAEIVDRELK